MIRCKAEKSGMYYIGERYYEEHKASLDFWLGDETISAYEFLSTIYPLFNSRTTWLRTWVEESWVRI
jgi:hypothetical protein